MLKQYQTKAYLIKKITQTLNFDYEIFTAKDVFFTDLDSALG